MVLPAAPDDVEPGAGRMRVARGRGVGLVPLVEVCGPEVGTVGVADEVDAARRGVVRRRPSGR